MKDPHESLPGLSGSLLDKVAERIEGRLIAQRLSAKTVHLVVDELAAAFAEIVATKNGREHSVQRERRSKVTPPQLARRWGVSRDKVLAWIRSGELRAINVANGAADRPRYLIDAKDVALFEARRAEKPMPKTGRRERRSISDDVVNFF